MPSDVDDPRPTGADNTPDEPAPVPVELPPDRDWVKFEPVMREAVPTDFLTRPFDRDEG
ncbi:hypothetical protein [Nocardia blacklockiae]|uniref:hypothetical protein n=1 Tax=Nocardia blacklockiae TaxID=480036 RepID=UPI001895DEA5|nr:hypothetical protein [Nocardia blacklockiae]MBF6175010.1 hypothetical protein [Nocardia blacklockiae]